MFDLLKVSLESFEGPLDLLLELIRKRKMDIGDISLAEICTPYLEHLELLQEFDMDIATEFLDIASTLILIKSRTLLPKPERVDEEEGLDTEEQLRAKLIEYQRYRRISEYFGQREILGRDTFSRPDLQESDGLGEDLPLQIQDLSVYGLLKAYGRSVGKEAYRRPHAVSGEAYPIERKIVELMDSFKSGRMLPFHRLFDSRFGRWEVVISFIAILELAKLMMITLHQMTAFGPIHCKPADNFEKMAPILQNRFRNVS